MTLWALRAIILGDGAWKTIRTEQNLARLQNSPRKRKPQKPYQCPAAQQSLF